MSVDFDKLAALAISDPEEFELERKRLLTAELEGIPDDLARARARKLLATYEKKAYGQDRLEVASIMMLESLDELQQQLLLLQDTQ